MRFFSLEIFQSLSEILFTWTGSEVYLTSWLTACGVTSSLVESGCRFVMSWSIILFSLYPPSSLFIVLFPRLRIHMDSLSHLVVLFASWSSCFAFDHPITWFSSTRQAVNQIVTCQFEWTRSLIEIEIYRVGKSHLFIGFNIEPFYKLLK